MSSSRLSLVLLILLLADIAAASQSPAASPTYAPKKKTPPTPAASPSPLAVSPAPATVPDISAPGPSAGTDCTMLLYGTIDCLTYVEAGSNLTVPDKACCPELAKLVNTNPICLCTLLKKGNSLGIDIDMGRALGLPAACKVETPDPSLCSLVNGPSGAPAPGSSPSDAVSPEGAGLPPTSVNNDKGAAVVGGSTSSFLVSLVAIAAFTLNMS